jgi:cytochrome c oxidase subunit 4
MDTPGSHGESHHEPTTRAYLGVLFALLLLTAATAGVSYLRLKHGSLAVALLIAVTKASLVLSWFMHLKWDVRLLRGVLSLALFLVAVFLGLSAVDWGPRDSGIERAHAASSSALATRGVR